MADIAGWIKILMAVMAVLWVVSLFVFAWILLGSRPTKDRAQYLLVRLHFFKGFGLEPGNEPVDDLSRVTRMAMVKILRLIVSTIAFINIITAMVLLLTGWWLSTISAEVGQLLHFLILVVGPLLALLGLYLIVLFFLLNGTYRRLLKEATPGAVKDA